jgi:serine/threonine-protein kinase RsbW
LIEGVTQQAACVQLELENRPQNVAIVRAALSGMAEAAELNEHLSTDLKTAVSEACNNVVLHAYDGGPGPMRVTVSYTPERIDVSVTDRGSGIKRLASGPEHMGLGLALISALADQAEFRSRADGGTEVRIRFRRSEQASEAGIPDAGGWPADSPALRGDVVMWCEPVAVMRHLLGRVARAIAATSHFTLAGAAELYPVNDALAAYAEAAADGHIVAAISGTSHRLTLDAGPFHTLEPVMTNGGASQAAASGLADGVAGRDVRMDGLDGRIADLDGHVAALDRLVDRLSFEPYDSERLLHVLLLDHGRGPLQ